MDTTIATTKQATYSIGIVARLTGISAHKLRMWERRYQLGPNRRSKGGQREFTRTEIDHLKLIKQLIDRGMRIGDIAQLPMKTLSSLLMDMGSEIAPTSNDNKQLSAAVFGTALTHYFQRHTKRFPELLFELSKLTAHEFLTQPSTSTDCDLIILQMDSLLNEHTQPLIELASQHRHIIIFYHYLNEDIRSMLLPYSIILVAGGVDENQIDKTLQDSITIKQNLENLPNNGNQFLIPLPTALPRIFDEQALSKAQKKKHPLDCKCPEHLVDLIRRLNAFEDYSKDCEANSWHEAATHACIHTYTNQARALIEKALNAALHEQIAAK